jgi:hypothetical protein
MRGACVAFAGLLWAWPASAQVSGTVVDVNTVLPLEGARVTIQASALETTTDAQGKFDIAGASGDVVVVAGKQGFFYASVLATAPASALFLQLDAVPLEDDPSYSLATSSQCSTCHPQQYGEWLSSPMGKAGTNSWVYDIYDGTGTSNGDQGFVYVRDSVHASAHPESECRSCHQPAGWVDTPFSALAPLATAPADELHGVTCEVCHKIAAVDDAKPNYPGLYPGSVTLTRPASAGWNVQYGVLGDVTFEVAGQMQGAYQPQLVAAVCGTCHQDKNDPDGDGDFEESNGVISEPTYVEWLDSEYSDPGSPLYATCVDCHMPAVAAGDACVVQSPSLGRPAGDVRSHAILGTTAEYLEDALSLSLELVEQSTELVARVTVINDRTGHHVPTGVTIRNVLLLVDAWRDADQTPLAHTGSQLLHDLAGVGDPAQGYFAGLPGKLFGKVNQDADGNGPVFFTDATAINFDSRIPALASDLSEYSFAKPEAPLVARAGRRQAMDHDRAG